MISCIIIEDEIPAQKVIEHYLSKITDAEIAGVFNTATDANTFLNAKSVDLVFLDINLPDIPGIDFIATLKEPPFVIMTTAYPDYAVSSFELDTIVDYMVKPFSFNRFLKAFKKAQKAIENPQKRNESNGVKSIFLNVDKSFHKIVFEELIYLESDRNYVTVVTKNQKLSYIDSLKNWMERLPDGIFIQVHKSYIINVHYAEKISGNEIYVNGNKLPIGRVYKQGLLQSLNIV